MEVHKYTGKDYDEVLKLALEDLNLSRHDVVIHKEEIKGGLFKSATLELTVTPLTDVIEYIKNYLNDLLSIMGLEVTFESKIRDNQITIKMHSNDNPILIGHNGKTLSSLQVVIRQVVKKEFGTTPYISLDVEDYKDKQIMHLKKTAIRIAKEVEQTKIPVEMDNMNAYERLIVHNALSNFKSVYTESAGEEPNRHVVIKPKEQ